MDDKKLREAFGQFGTGVAIVTLCGADDVPCGLTVNSFASVSLAPPLLSWCLDKNSDMAAAFGAAEAFCVNVLAAEHKTLSEQMAQVGEHILAAEWVSREASGAVLINGALASFECRVAERIAAGDHIIYLGAVRHAHFCLQNRAPLLYFRGDYAALKATD